jgi:protein TonB
MFAAVTVTAILFTALPLLSQVEIRKKRTTQGSRILINSPKPPPPPEPEKEKEKEKPEVRKIESYKSKQTTKTKPKFDLPSFGFSKVGDIDISISNIIKDNINFTNFDFPTQFDLTEVDSIPVVKIQSQPLYPYYAKREGIEGVVSVRFLVTKEGDVDRVSVIRSEPEGVFEEATKKCVSRWRFNPGIKDGEAVDTWVEIDIEFELERT